jgi:hypothetical protein
MKVAGIFLALALLGNQVQAAPRKNVSRRPAAVNAEVLLSKTPAIKTFLCKMVGNRNSAGFNGIVETDVYALSAEHALAQSATFFWTQGGQDPVASGKSAANMPTSDQAIRYWEDISCIPYK